MDTHVYDSLNRATRRQNAAYLVTNARMTEFQAALQVGTPKEIEEARSAAVAAYEAYLDAVSAAVWWGFKASGLDPDNRG